MDKNEELTAFRDNIANVLRKECGLTELQQWIETGSDLPVRIQQIAAELGWLGLTIPERFDGLDLDFSFLHVIYQEFGKVVAPFSVLSTMLAAQAILLGGSEQQKQGWLPGIASGECNVAFVPAQATESLLVNQSEDGLALKGKTGVFLGNENTDLFVLAITRSSRTTLLMLRSDQAGLACHPRQMTDRSRQYFALDLRDVAIDQEVILDAADAAAITAIGDHAVMGIAADAVGCCEEMLNTTVEYMKVRTQFGKQIGSFQALKHRAADHQSALVAAETLGDGVAREIAECGHSEACFEANILATSTAFDITKDCVQLHGGIGYTAEHHAHLYLKRSLINLQLLGSLEARTDEAVRRYLA